MFVYACSAVNRTSQNPTRCQILQKGSSDTRTRSLLSASASRRRKNERSQRRGEVVRVHRPENRPSLRVQSPLRNNPPRVVLPLQCRMTLAVHQNNSPICPFAPVCNPSSLSPPISLNSISPVILSALTVKVWVKDKVTD